MGLFLFRIFSAGGFSVYNEIKLSRLSLDKCYVVFPGTEVLWGLFRFRKCSYQAIMIRKKVDFSLFFCVCLFIFEFGCL